MDEKERDARAKEHLIDESAGGSIDPQDRIDGIRYAIEYWVSEDHRLHGDTKQQERPVARLDDLFRSQQICRAAKSRE